MLAGRLSDNRAVVSSTVTTATVSTVTAAVTIEGLGQVFTLIALVLLGIVLLAKEISAGSTSRNARALARGLDISIAPLLMVFLVMLVLNATTFLQVE
jgi:heme O synthase-like polyprenyltransferase